jgi:hypothetical protein
MNATSQVEKFKARLVAKGYSQVEVVDFGKIFSPVAKLTSIRLLMSLVATFDLEIEQISHHQESQSLTHGGGWEGQNPAKSISEKRTQFYPRKGHEKYKVQKTDSKGL